VVRYYNNNNVFEIWTDGKLATYIVNTNNFSVTANTPKTLTSFDSKYSPAYVVGIKNINNYAKTAVVGDGKVEIISTDTNGYMWGTATVQLKNPL